MLLNLTLCQIHYLVHGKIGDYVLPPGSDMVRCFIMYKSRFLAKFPHSLGARP